MIDERLKKLCNSLVNYSMKIKKGEKVLIENFDCPAELSAQLIKEVYAAGGIPYSEIRQEKIQRELLMGATKEQIEDITRYDSMRMQDMDAYVAFRGKDNSSELADVPEDNMKLYSSVYSKKVHHDIRVGKQNGWFCGSPTARWHSLQDAAQNSSKTFISTYATSTIQRWTKQWML